MPPEDIWTDDLGFIHLGTSERERLKQATKEVMKNLPREHPEVFDTEPIDPDEYGRLFETAIHSIDGELKAKRGKENEDHVREIFLKPARDAGHLEFEDQRSDERVDFKGRLTDGTTFAMDVKGGEGQSIGHLLVPANTDLLTVWSQRNSTNTKPPASRLNEVINRMVRWGFNQAEDPALMVIHDPPAGARTDGGDVVPDVVVLPEHFPTLDSPDPPMRDVNSMDFVQVLYETTIGESDLDSELVRKHLWFHDLWLEDPDEKIVGKEIYNAHYGHDLTLTTRSIDLDRISEVS